MKGCSVDGCEGKHRSRGWCRTHYDHWCKYGDPLKGSFRQTAEQRFWEKVNKTDDCWLWTAATWKSRGGAPYGHFTVDGVHIVAHRYAFKVTYGDPESLQVDHRCHNTLCVNPIHLRLATNKQNHENLRGPNSQSTSGIRGVSWLPRRSKWIARVMHHRHSWQRSFDTKEEAEYAAVAKRNELFSHNDQDRKMPDEETP